MQKMMIVVIVLFATVLSNSARAEESKFKISMTILSGETVISSPVMVTSNNKVASVLIDDIFLGVFYANRNMHCAIGLLCGP